LVRCTDKNIRNKKGELPYDLAIENRNINIADILSARDSIVHSPYISNHEITRLRDSHNNITLFVIFYLWDFLNGFTYLEFIIFIKKIFF